MRGDTFSIFNHVKSCFEDVVLNAESQTCEAACIQLCRLYGISPLTQPLFNLRYLKTQNWLSPCRELKPDVKYELRLRYKVPDQKILRQNDKVVYNYLFCQIRYDLLNNKIPEINYSKHKNEIAGLAVADMYRDMIENHAKIDYLIKNYKSYVPKEMAKNHPVILKKRMEKHLRQIDGNPHHEADYVKTSYLEQINALAPNCLIEEYQGNAPYPEDEADADNHRNRTCPVKIQFSPFDPEQPGLRIFYSFISKWKHVTRIEDVLAIIIDGKRIKIAIKDKPELFILKMADEGTLESLVTCITGYYRLMYKWNFDLCTQLPTPSLQFLAENKCHGPVGAQFSYTKLKDNNEFVGAYIVRQCVKEYDTYYIDMRTTPEQIQTFKITYKRSDGWTLHRNDTETERGLTNLTELAKQIRSESQSIFRLAPSVYEKADSLLLCQPLDQNRVKKTVRSYVVPQNRNGSSKPQIIDPETELQIYKKPTRSCEDDSITQMRAEWKVSGTENLEVTLRILKTEYAHYSSKLLKLASQWAKLNSSDILKLYGLTLDNPLALVMESTQLGPFNEFLQMHPHIEPYCLVDAALSLAQAVHYLHDNKIVHTRIRCSNLFVVAYTSPKYLKVKLGDQGFKEVYTDVDRPWIPPEYRNCMQLAMKHKKADSYAFSTTLWEIFSFGKNPVYYMQRKKPLPSLPKSCPRAIISIINEGWDPDPDNRFSLQTLFTRLITAKDALSTEYTDVAEPLLMQGNHHGSQSSIITEETDLTHHENGDTTSEKSSIDDTASTMSQQSTSTYDSSQITNGVGYTPNGSDAMASDQEPMIDDDYADHKYNHIPQILELEVGKVIIGHMIGRGHYGTVHKASLEDSSDYPFGKIHDVAVKQMNENVANSVIDDFKNEIDIMKSLNHPNIVRIIDFTEKHPASIVMEYIQDSSLNNYLPSHPDLKIQNLLKFSKDIASGMEYLAKKNIVHRDLAARNVLVGAKEVLKISDFGLAKQAGPTGYYTIGTPGRSIPIKWYAPEIIQLQKGEKTKYSFKSDVWSYGVTLFEIFSRGQSQPDLIPENKNLEPTEILKLLQGGVRLKRPNQCPEDIWDSLVYICWHIQPEKRPSFSDILKLLNQVIGGYGEPV